MKTTCCQLMLATLVLASPALASEHVVTLRAHDFVPAQLEVQPGDTVAFVNEGRELDYVYENRLAWGAQVRAHRRQVVPVPAGRRLVFQSARGAGRPLVVAVRTPPSVALQPVAARSSPASAREPR